MSNNYTPYLSAPGGLHRGAPGYNPKGNYVNNVTPTGFTNNPSEFLAIPLTPVNFLGTPVNFL